MITLFGCTHTTLHVAKFLNNLNLKINLITISPSTAKSNEVAGFIDLTLYKKYFSSIYVAKNYSLKSEKDEKQLKSYFKSDLGFCIGWQRLIPLKILTTFSKGIYGMHGSSRNLPFGKGRSPMNWAIIEGRKWFHTNLFRYQDGIDNGPIVDTLAFSINNSDSIETLQYKNVISIFPGSRKSEIDVLLPILFNFIKKMNNNNNNYNYFIHTNEDNVNYINNKVQEINIKNIEVIFDEDIKEQVLLNSVFAVCKSGTVSLQVSNSKVPSIIIYKLSFVNFMIFKMLVNVKFANIINIINNREVIPELLQNECNADEIYKSVIYMLKHPNLIEKQLNDCSKTLEGIKSKTSSSEEASLVLRNYLS